MTMLFSNGSFKSGLLALGLAASVSASSFAAPLTLPSPAIAQSPATQNIIPVREGWAGNGNVWHNRGAAWHGRGGGGGWHGGEHWRGRGGWRGRGRGGWGGGGWGDDYWLPGALGLGLGLGVPYYYNYGPGYYPRYYAPRRVYRINRGDAHVRWCYNRYRSYRAYDNTFQPNNGPRRQCRSPF